MRLAGLTVMLALMPGIAEAQTTTYRYDARGRLIGSTNTRAGQSVETVINHDAADNRVRYQVNGAASGSSGSGGGSASSNPNDPGAGASTPAARTFIVVPLNGFTVIPVS